MLIKIHYMYRYAVDIVIYIYILMVRWSCRQWVILCLKHSIHSRYMCYSKSRLHHWQLVQVDMMIKLKKKKTENKMYEKQPRSNNNELMMMMEISTNVSNFDDIHHIRFFFSLFSNTISKCWAYLWTKNVLKNKKSNFFLIRAAHKQREIEWKTNRRIKNRQAGSRHPTKNSIQFEIETHHVLEIIKICGIPASLFTISQIKKHSDAMTIYASSRASYGLILLPFYIRSRTWFVLSCFILFTCSFSWQCECAV